MIRYVPAEAVEPPLLDAPFVGLISKVYVVLGARITDEDNVTSSSRVPVLAASLHEPTGAAKLLPL